MQNVSSCSTDPALEFSSGKEVEATRQREMEAFTSSVALPRPRILVVCPGLNVGHNMMVLCWQVLMPKGQASQSKLPCD